MHSLLSEGKHQEGNFEQNLLDFISNSGVGKLLISADIFVDFPEDVELVVRHRFEKWPAMFGMFFHRGEEFLLVF